MTKIFEMHFVDLSDEELKETVGGLHERIKGLEEQMKLDEEAERLKKELADYLDYNYRNEIRLFRVKLKAARAQSHVRGLRFNLPGE